MTLEQYWNALTKRWLLIVGSIVLLGLGAYFGSKLLTPLYQSTALIQVNILSSNNQTDISTSEGLAQTEAQLALSDPVLRPVASLYHGLTVSQVAKEATATLRSNAPIVQIDVLDANPTRAAALANDIATTLINQQVQLVQQNNAQSQQKIQQNILQTQQQIETINRKIATLQAQQENNTVQISVLQTQQQTDSNIQKIATLQAQQQNIAAQINPLQNQLNALQQQQNQSQLLLTQMELTEAQSDNFLRVVQPAQPASAPVQPNVPLNTAAGLLIGLINGLSLAILLELLDTRIRTEEALTQFLGWSVLATIWHPDALKKGKHESELLVDPPQHSANVEAYRILRTNIGFSGIDKPVRSIMVTSALPKEGKSTIAANLAIFMAKAGKKTLLVDVDLRRPTQAKIFHFPLDKPGLSNAVVACANHQFALPSWQSDTQPLARFSLSSYMHATDIPNLLIMPTGPLPPNPPELLDSKAMAQFIGVLQGCGAEVIIFDTPPLLGLSDANILAPKVDGVLVVVDITNAHKKNLKRIKTQLAQSDNHVLGCVVNKQSQKHKDTAYSYYYSYRLEEEDRSKSMYYSIKEDQSKSMHNGHNPGVLTTQGSWPPSQR